jgi:hypothetical protein
MQRVKRQHRLIQSSAETTRFPAVALLSVRVSFQQNPDVLNQTALNTHLYCVFSVSLLLWKRFYFSLADVPLIHHHNPLRCGKQPKLPPKMPIFAPFFVDHFCFFANRQLVTFICGGPQ